MSDDDWGACIFAYALCVHVYCVCMCVCVWVCMCVCMCMYVCTCSQNVYQQKHSKQRLSPPHQWPPLHLWMNRRRRILKTPLLLSWKSSWQNCGVVSTFVCMLTFCGLTRTHTLTPSLLLSYSLTLPHYSLTHSLTFSHSCGSQKHILEFDSYRKGVEAQKAPKNDNKKDKNDLEKMLSDEERKMREKALMEASDLANAFDLFGGNNTYTYRHIHIHIRMPTLFARLNYTQWLSSCALF